MNDFNPDPSTEFTRQVPTCPASGGLPAGGTTSQVLTKQSNDDGNADWETPATATNVAQVDYYIRSPEEMFYTIILDTQVPITLLGIRAQTLYSVESAELTLYVNGEPVAEATSLVVDNAGVSVDFVAPAAVVSDFPTSISVQIQLVNVTPAIAPIAISIFAEET